MYKKHELDFFKAFDIKPTKGCIAYDKFGEDYVENNGLCDDHCLNCKYRGDVYPIISEEKLIKLLCITINEFYWKPCVYKYTPDKLKIEILEFLTLEIGYIKEDMANGDDEESDKYKRVLKAVRNCISR